jgi:hypothetical protein
MNTFYKFHGLILCDPVHYCRELQTFPRGLLPQYSGKIEPSKGKVVLSRLTGTRIVGEQEGDGGDNVSHPRRQYWLTQLRFALVRNEKLVA